MRKLSVKPLHLILSGLGLALIVYALYPKGISYTNVGIYAICIFGFLTFINFAVFDLIEFKYKAIIRKIISVFLGTSLAVFTVASIIIYTVPREVSGKGNYTLVVMGAKVIGAEPSGVLKGRLDTAYDYLISNPEIKCIVSGGKGSDEEVTEAYVMKEYLVSHGISEKRIYTEDEAKSTRENIEFSLEVARENSLNESFVICTDAYHQYRAALFCNENDIACYSLNSPIVWSIEPIYLVREILAVFYYFIL